MTRPRLLMFAIGAAASLVLAVVVLRNPDPPLTRETLDAARRMWQARGPKSYAMALEVDGRIHALEVVDGRVAELTIDGRPAPPDTREHWGVDGLFGFLEIELANAADPKRSYGIDDPGHVVIRAAFDGEHGLPRRFFRHVIGRQAAIRWEVRDFTPK